VRALIVVAMLGALACRGSSQSDGGGGGGGGGGVGADGQTSQTPPPESEAPVALNPEVPIAYPPALYDRKIEGDVTLRLFVDSTGKLIPESTRVADPSGYSALDSAALAGSKTLKFAPAKRHGVAVATAFLQPVEFRQVGTTRSGTMTLPPPPQPAAVQARPQPPPPAPVVRPRPDTTRADTTRPRADTTRARADTTRPPPRPPPPPPPPPPPDTTKPRPDTSATAH